MTALGCADVREKAPELALDVLSGPERAAALEHVSECAACRSLLAEFTEAVDVVPFLAAEAEPPVGFRDRVVQQMTSPPRSSRRRWPAVLAAAAVTVAVVVAATALLVNGRGGSTQSTAAGPVRPVAGNARSTAMIGAGNEQIGRLFVTNRDPAVMMLSVDYPVPSGTYTVQQRTDHRTTRLGEMQVNAGHGTWGGVTVTGGHGSVQLVDPNGSILCQARIPTA
jgi:Putative zinc-finger